jgi:membrane-bound metal-dependent hydrolase YbcI (DUF457 family)
LSSTFYNRIISITLEKDILSVKLMLGKTHLGIGLLVGAAAPFVGLAGPDSALAWAALAIGSLAPDLDGQGFITKPSTLVPEVIPLPSVVDRTGGTVGRAIAGVFGHRGALHYPIVVIILGALAIYLNSPVLLWLAVGYMSHLVADSLTKMGIPALGPLSSRRFGIGPRLLRLSTGSKPETLIMVMVWGSFWILTVIQMAGLSFLLQPQRDLLFTTFLPIVAK